MGCRVLVLAVCHLPQTRPSQYFYSKGDKRAPALSAGTVPAGGSGCLDVGDELRFPCLEITSTAAASFEKKMHLETKIRPKAKR